MKKVYRLTSEEQTLVVLDGNVFEKTKLCECYNDYGQEIGCENAGCYTLDNSYAESCILRDLEAELGSDDITTPAAKNWLKENTSHEYATAYTYWDGNNNRTLILQQEHGEVDLEEVEEELSTEILRELKNVDFDDFKHGKCTVESGRFSFTKTQYASDPFYCEVEEL